MPPLVPAVKVSDAPYREWRYRQPGQVVRWRTRAGVLGRILAVGPEWLLLLTDEGATAVLAAECDPLTKSEKEVLRMVRRDTGGGRDLA